VYHAECSRDYTLVAGNGHTGRMDLLTLNLSTKLEWTENIPAGPGSIRAAISAIGNAPEGSEAVLCWHWDEAVVHSGDSGPTTAHPFPEPEWLAMRIATTSMSTVIRTLEAGRYLFAQAGRPPEPDDPTMPIWLAEKIEWFAREAWWTRSTATGPLFVRLVREDSKTAVQLLRQTQ